MDTDWLVRWIKVDDHMQRIRGSTPISQWRALLQPFFANVLLFERAAFRARGREPGGELAAGPLSFSDPLDNRYDRTHQNGPERPSESGQ